MRGSCRITRYRFWSVAAAMTVLFGGVSAALAQAKRAGWQVTAWEEFHRPSPLGGTVRVDWRGKVRPKPLKPKDGALTIKAARGGYASLHLAITHPTGGKFTLSASAAGGIEIDLFREWFHLNRRNGKYLSDALIPVKPGETLSLPDPQMKIPAQKVVGVWVDIWIPAKATPGVQRASIELTAGGKRQSMALRIEVLETVIPAEDTLTADHNSYGDGWIERYFAIRAKRAKKEGRKFFGSDEFFDAIHTVHRMFYEHRGLLHQLGYVHAGQVLENFAPELAGSGRTKRIKSWEKYDRHYGPLLDGSAFAKTRRGKRAVASVYLPINLNWPADYLWWGQPGYETEFVRVVSQMEKHFRDKGWTNTNFEMFFNHKTRFKVFSWDGDETRFPKDNAFFKEMGRLLGKSAPAKGPVKFVFRHDASWLMRQQFDDLAGVVNLWICNRGIYGQYPEAADLLRRRGDKVWIYGSAPNAFGPTIGVAGLPVRAWMNRADGFVHWLVTNVAGDPWFKFNGGGTGMFFPGGKFGVDGPLPSIRLKIQRNILQDIALLDDIGKRIGAREIRQKVAALAGLTADDWWRQDTAMKKRPPWEWTNRDIGSQPARFDRVRHTLDGRWWLAARKLALAGRQVKK